MAANCVGGGVSEVFPMVISYFQVLRHSHKSVAVIGFCGELKGQDLVNSSVLFYVPTLPFSENLLSWTKDREENFMVLGHKMLLKLCDARIIHVTEISK